MEGSWEGRSGWRKEKANKAISALKCTSAVTLGTLKQFMMKGIPVLEEMQHTVKQRQELTFVCNIKGVCDRS